MRPHLLTWQWSLYPDGHRNRRNLLLHITTVPVFLAGTLLVLAAPLVSLWTAPLGLVAMAGAMGAQGRGHRREETPPVPFAGPADVLARIFLEQWVTFPRFVLSGGFARAWRATVSGAATAPAPR